VKKCSKCKLEKEINNFVKDKNRKDGYYPQCKECNLEYAKAYYLKNKNKINKRHRHNNKIYHAKPENKIKRQKRENQRYKTDINWRLTNILRSRIRSAIKNNQKSGSAISDLGCSIEKFKLWIEMNWKDGMTWDNHGLYGWHIDHIIPLSLFNLSIREEFLKASHFTNLQPLWAKDNLIKQDKIL